MSRTPVWRKFRTFSTSFLAVSIYVGSAAVPQALSTPPLFPLGNVSDIVPLSDPGCTDIAAGDLNGDGRSDLALCGSNAVIVLLSLPGGGFGPMSVYQAGANPRSIAIGDLNGDGRNDLAVANFAPNTVSVLLASPSGGFEPRIEYPAGEAPDSGAGPIHVAIGDLNGDGWTDLATASAITPGSVSVLLGAGDGTFGAKTDYDVGYVANSVAIGDLNGDGRLDLAVAHAATSSAVSVLLGSVGGGFAPYVDYPTGSNSYSVAIGDPNADGRLDLAVAKVNSPNVGIFLGLAGGMQVNVSLI